MKYTLLAKRPTLIVLALFLASACGTLAPLAAQTPLTVFIAIQPAQPHVGPADIDVRVVDADGKPVSGATVTIIASMPVMRMGQPMPMASMGMLGPPLQVKDVGNGYYRAHITLNHATLWTFVAHAKTKQAYATSTLSVVVKDKGN